MDVVRRNLSHTRLALCSGIFQLALHRLKLIRQLHDSTATDVEWRLQRLRLAIRNVRIRIRAEMEAVLARLSTTDRSMSLEYRSAIYLCPRPETIRACVHTPLYVGDVQRSQETYGQMLEARLETRSCRASPPPTRWSLDSSGLDVDR